MPSYTVLYLLDSEPNGSDTIVPMSTSMKPFLTVYLNIIFIVGDINEYAD